MNITQKTDYNSQKKKVMNKNISKSIRTGFVAMASLLACYSCSDTWDDHYNPTLDNSTVVDATIYQQMKTLPELSDFVQIIDATGYKALLDETQIVTVFAPRNGTFDKEELLAELAAGNVELVNTRFVKNHIARYNFSSNTETQRVELLNKKLTTLSDGYVGQDSVAIKSKNTICNNGVLHVLESQLPFHANIYELMETTADMDSIYNIFSAYDEDSLDVNRSVYRGVDEDGNRIYVDSVMIKTNDLMSRLYGYMHREDSNYVVIVPSNDALTERLNETRSYFVYNIHEEDRDSLQDYYSRYYTLNTLIYNNNINLHQNDSLVTTTYSKWDPNYNVFYKPFEQGGLLASDVVKEKIECSNGIVYTTDKFPSTIYDSFFREIRLECEHTGNINVEMDDKATPLFTKTCNYTVTSSNDPTVSNRAYLDVQPSTSSAQPYIGFNIPGTLSGEYDIYLVTVPLKMGRGVLDADTLKPYQFRVNMFYRTNRATDLSANWPSSKSKTLTNPDGKNGSNFISNPEKVDTIYLGTEKFTECYYGSSRAGVMIQIQAYVSSTQTKTYSRRMLLDRIILKPKGMPERGKDARNEELAGGNDVAGDTTEE